VAVAMTGRHREETMNRSTKLTVVASSQGADRPRPRWHFDHHRLDAYFVALEALEVVHEVAGEMKKGHGKLKDHLVRAVDGVFTQTVEAAARTGADRAARFRVARAEAAEAAAVLEALERLALAQPDKVDRALGLLWRLSAMLTKLARL